MKKAPVILNNNCKLTDQYKTKLLIPPCMQKCIHEEHSQPPSYKGPVSVEGAVKNQFHHV